MARHMISQGRRLGDLEAASDDVQHGEHAIQAHRRLPSFELHEEAKADPGCSRKLVLTEPLGESGLTDRGANLFSSHEYSRSGTHGRIGLLVRSSQRDHSNESALRNSSQVALKGR